VATATLLAGVGHEINNPLAIIAAQALMLAEDAEGTPLATRAEAIRLAAERCGRIVQSLMRSARRRARRREEVRIAEAVDQGLDLAGYGLRAAGIDLTLDVPAELPPLQGDPEQLAHVVSNLVSNAQHAFEDAAVPAPRRLRIAAAREREAIVLRVADNGPGIPAEMRARIFDAFFTTRTPGHGSGVGLALCRAVVEAHGGRIAVEATPGGGATFVIRLPLGGAGRRGAEP
jgi:two-component system NtrC family sensor kinase